MNKNPKAKRMSSSSGVCIPLGCPELVMWVVLLAFVGAKVSLYLDQVLEETSSLASDTETVLEHFVVFIPVPHLIKSITIVNNGGIIFLTTLLMIWADLHQLLPSNQGCRKAHSTRNVRSAQSPCAFMPCCFSFRSPGFLWMIVWTEHMLLA